MWPIPRERNRYIFKGSTGALRRKVTVSHYPRFDLGEGVLASDRELHRRWKAFHAAARSHSSSTLTRLVGPLLGDDTRRRRLAQSLESRLRGNQLPALPSAPPIESLLVPAPPMSATPDMLARCAVVSIDTAALAVSFDDLDAAVANSEWLLIAPSHTDAESALATLWPMRDNADVVFADELRDHIPLFKPPVVGPLTLLGMNVIGRPALLRTATIRAIGGFARAAASACDHDVYLRLQEAGARFVHVPVTIPVDTSHGTATTDDTQAVVSAAFARRGLPAVVTSVRPDGLVSWEVTLTETPLVDIIIPTRDRLDLLERCISSVEGRSTYPNYRITILDNDSVDPATLAYFATTPHRVVPCPGPFNYAAIMNRGVASTTAPLIVTLNNDTVIETPDWLERMVGVTLLAGVAATGCRQVDQFGHHEHDGVVIAPYPQHLIYGRNWFLDDYLVNARREVTAVTGAVTMVRRSAWEAVDGMDEDFAVVMNDVDLCLRLQNNGGAVVIVPDVVIRHDASSSRGRLDPLVDRNRFVRRWDIFGTFRDPYFPAALQLLGAHMVVREPRLDHTS